MRWRNLARRIPDPVSLSPATITLTPTAPFVSVVGPFRVPAADLHGREAVPLELDDEPLSESTRVRADHGNHRVSRQWATGEEGAARRRDRRSRIRDQEGVLGLGQGVVRRKVLNRDDQEAPGVPRCHRDGVQQGHVCRRRRQDKK